MDTVLGMRTTVRETMGRCPCCRHPLQRDVVAVDRSTNTLAVSWTTRTVRLDPTKTEIALLLWEAVPAGVETDKLIRQIWGAREPGEPEAVLHQHISKMRKELAPLGLTIPLAWGQNGTGRGTYRLVREGGDVMIRPSQEPDRASEDLIAALRRQSAALQDRVAELERIKRPYLRPLPSSGRPVPAPRIELADLRPRDRIEALRVVLRISPKSAVLMDTLLRLGDTTWQEARIALRQRGSSRAIAVHLHQLRRALLPHGIQIASRKGFGILLGGEAQERFRKIMEDRGLLPLFEDENQMDAPRADDPDSLASRKEIP